MNENTNIYTLPERIKEMPEAAKLKIALDRFCRLNVIDRLHGNCIAASDILQNILNFYGIKSKIMECQVFAAQDNREIQDYRMIGFNTVGLNHPNIVDTHVVVVTETTPALLIDASIGYMLPPEQQIIVHVVEGCDAEVIGEHDVGNGMIISYHHKKNIKLPALHQKNIIERIQEERVIFNNIDLLKTAIFVIGAISVVNFILNMSLVVFELLFD